MKETILIDWNSRFIDEHRRGLSDMEWADAQRQGEPKYMFGDVVEFMVGGFGVIKEVSYNKNSGSPPSYSTENIKGFDSHKTAKIAWHYERDFKRLVSKSNLRSLIC